MSLDAATVLRHSRFLRAVAAACVCPSAPQVSRDPLHLPATLLGDLSVTSPLVRDRLAEARPANSSTPAAATTTTTTATATTTTSATIDAVPVECTRTASCKCRECAAAMAAVAGVPDVVTYAGSGRRSGSGSDLSLSRETFVRATPEERVALLADGSTGTAAAVCEWVASIVGATSATRAQMVPQEALIAALDEAAVWQQRQARSETGLALGDTVEARERVCLEFRTDSVLAALLRGGAFASVVALCAGPADCVRWRALSLLLHCRCADGDAIAQAHKLPYLEPDEYACSPRVHHLSDRVYTQFFDVDSWIGPLAAAGMSPRSTLIPLSVTDLRLLKSACEAAERATIAGVDFDGDTTAAWKYLCGSDGDAPGGAHASALYDLATRVDAAIATQASTSGAAAGATPTGAFVKLSTRSPKDSTLFTKRASRATGLDAECEGAPMKAASGAEALALLATSERVHEDVVAALAIVQDPAGAGAPPSSASSAGASAGAGADAGDGAATADGNRGAGSQEGGLSLVVREWWYVPRWTEMRGFVRRATPRRGVRALTALSQYYLDDSDVTGVGAALVASNATAVCNAVHAFVRERLDAVLDEIGIDHAVVDFALRAATSTSRDNSYRRSPASGGESGPDETVVRLDGTAYEVVVLELNSFGFRSDGALFDWSDEADATRLFDGGTGEGGRAEFRTLVRSRA